MAVNGKTKSAITSESDWFTLYRENKIYLKLDSKFVISYITDVEVTLYIPILQ